MKNDTWKKLAILFIACAMTAVCALVIYTLAVYFPDLLTVIGISTIVVLSAGLVVKMGDAICDE